MTIPRIHQIDLSSTKFYHCTSRCVRQMFLYGKDIITGKDYSHRKKWIVDRINFLSSIFAIDICAYAVMSNHTHLVLYVNIDALNSWPDEEVRRRWRLLCPKDYSAFQQLEDKVLSEDQIVKKISQWRERLCSISWFMACLNEKIARMCNREDQCRGRFWEGRYKCQALLDEGAVISAMAYVDLNPIRAKIAETPEESKFTSIFDRIKHMKKQFNEINTEDATVETIDTIIQPKHLLTLGNKNNAKTFLDFKLSDYLQLVDTTGRLLKDNKRGRIPENIAPILTRLQIKPDHWLELMYNMNQDFSRAIGNFEKMIIYNRDKPKTLRGISKAKTYYYQAA